MIALSHKADHHHVQAVAFFQDIREQGSLHLSNYVLDELLTRLGHRLGSRAAVAATDLIVSSRLYRVHWIQEDLHGEAYDLFRTIERKGPSFTDCTSFVLMRRLGFTTVFTFDRDFAVAGFEVVPHA